MKKVMKKEIIIMLIFNKYEKNQATYFVFTKTNL